MKTSFVSEINLIQAQPTIKPQSYKEQRKSRQNSKQGHMNPLKMKTSFLRQSLSLNTSQQNLTLNLNNPSTTQRNITPVQANNAMHSDRREDFMMRKIVERFSNNASPKNMMYPEHVQFVNQTQKERDIIKLSGRKNQHLGLSQIQKPLNQEKENHDKNQNRSFMNHSGVFTKNQPHLTINNDKNHRQSHDSTVQSVVLDNSLADYANSLNNSFLQSDQVSVLKEQLQLVLKRLAKNQCEIESLKRDKSIEAHMESVWKQLSLCEGKFEMIEKKCAKNDEKLAKFMQQIQEVKGQVLKIDKNKSSLAIEVKSLQSKLLTEVTQLQNKISQISLQQQQSQHQKISDGMKKIKSEMQGMLTIMNAQFQSRIETKFSQLKWDLKSDRIIQTQESNSSRLYGKNGNKFILSSKKAHESIAVVYKQILKVTKPSSPSFGQQPTYTNNDRKKLIQSVLNQSYIRKTTYPSSLPVTPQRTTSDSYFRSCTDDNSKLDIEINQVEYFIDSDGYLLDDKQYYILDDKGEQIRLDQSMIELMVRNGVLKG